MVFKIYYQVGEYSDEVTISGDSVEEIRQKADEFFESRGLVGKEVVTGSEQIS